MRIIPGLRFGRLVTLADAGRSADKHRLWLCRCDCGNEVIRQSNVIQRSETPSCGCAASDVQVKHGGKYTREYSSWQSAIQRCENKFSKDYARYGARGIQICARWRESFEEFREDMGPRPPKTTLERNDVDGNYEPGNCVWATATTQSRNKRKSIWLDWNGERRHLSEIAEMLGITYGAAFMRLKRGKL